MAIVSQKAEAIPTVEAKMLYFYSHHLKNAIAKDIPIAIAQLIGEFIQAILDETAGGFLRIGALQVLALRPNFVTRPHSGDNCMRAHIRQVLGPAEKFPGHVRNMCAVLNIDRR